MEGDKQEAVTFKRINDLVNHSNIHTHSRAHFAHTLWWQAQFSTDYISQLNPRGLHYAHYHQPSPSFSAGWNLVGRNGNATTYSRRVETQD
jgi:hypothetical protein